MTTLIFGAAGQVGRALVQTAPNHAQLIALDRVACDLTDVAQIERAVIDHRPLRIFNAAAFTAVDAAEGDPKLAHAVNVLAPEAMAKVACQIGAQLIHISTDFVFGDEGPALPRSPNDPASPQGVYARTKLEGERRVMAAAEMNLIVRTAWVHSPGGPNFVTTMLRLMRQSEVVKVVADQIGTPTSVTTLARALWSLTQLKAHGVHHFTDAGVASWYDFAYAIQDEAVALRLLERKVQITPISTSDYPTPARRPAYSVLDKSRTWKLLGGPAPHWREGLRATLQDMMNG